MEFFNKRKSAFELCVKVFSVLIDGWCKIRRVDMGGKLLREMIDKGIEPNVVCYNILLNGICRKSSLHPDARFDRTIRVADKVPGLNLMLLATLLYFMCVVVHINQI